MIAEQDAHYASYGLLGRFGGTVLKYTIAYGHHPLLAIGWSLAVVLLGWAVVHSAKAAKVMRPTYPENVPASAPSRYERLYPLLYSLDVFVPFVNLHQEHYWWPDAEASGELRLLGVPTRLTGSWVLYYLWFQIIAGWVLSAVFVAETDLRAAAR